MVAIKRSARKLAPPLCRRNANLGQAENQPFSRRYFGSHSIGPVLASLRSNESERLAKSSRVPLPGMERDRGTRFEWVAGGRTARLDREQIRPVCGAVNALSAQGQKLHFSLHAGRSQPDGLVRAQAQAARASRQTTLPHTRNFRRTARPPLLPARHHRQPV